MVNTYRRNAATQLLELFGRRFDYRDRENLTDLMAAANFELTRLVAPAMCTMLRCTEKICDIACLAGVG